MKNKEDLSSAFDLLSSVGEKDKEFVWERHDVLLNACRMIGKRIGIAFIAPPFSDTNGDAHSHLEAICSASEVTFRKISLKGKWWQEESGHFVSFFANTPIACVWENDNYWMLNAKTGEKQHVDKTLASQIADYGFEFYTPLPINKSLVKFALTQEKKTIFAAFLLIVLASLSLFFIPLSIRYHYDVMLVKGENPFAWQFRIGSLLALLSAFILYFLFCIYLLKVVTIAAAKIEKGFWDRLFKLPANIFKKYPVGNLWRRLAGFSEVLHFFDVQLASSLFWMVPSLFFLAAMFYFSPFLALTAVFSLLFVLCLTIFYLPKIKRLYGQIQISQRKIQGFLFQAILGLRFIKQTGKESQIFELWAAKYSWLKNKDYALQCTQAYLRTIFTAAPIFIFLCLIVHQLYGRSLSLGNFFGFMISLAFFAAPLLTLMATLSKMTSLVPLWEKAQPLLILPLEKTERKLRPNSFQGHLILEGLVFRYPKNESFVLKNCTLNIAAKTRIAILGASSSGKSALMHLIAGFHLPEQGEILYDNITLSHFDMRYMRRHISVLLQNSAILDGSIYDNLVCGKFYSNEEIHQALEISHFKQELEHFPMGLNTLLINGGVSLSARENQMLLFARAVIARPKVLLLDEPLSAVDDEEYEQILDSTMRLEATTIIFSTRLRAASYFDDIYILKEGTLHKKQL